MTSVHPTKIRAAESRLSVPFHYQGKLVWLARRQFGIHLVELTPGGNSKWTLLGSVTELPIQDRAIFHLVGNEIVSTRTCLPSHSLDWCVDLDTYRVRRVYENSRVHQLAILRLQACRDLVEFEHEQLVPKSGQYILQTDALSGFIVSKNGPLYV